eukprot:m.56102 g.56102  ORF g.56102 m.56102 type:complete len:230 (-) comp12579_c0_seq3:156-845(-)
MAEPDAVNDLERLSQEATEGYNYDAVQWAEISQLKPDVCVAVQDWTFDLDAAADGVTPLEGGRVMVRSSESSTKPRSSGHTWTTQPIGPLDGWLCNGVHVVQVLYQKVDQHAGDFNYSFIGLVSEATAEGLRHESMFEAGLSASASSGTVRRNGSKIGMLAPFSQGDIITMLVDMDTKSLWFWVHKSTNCDKPTASLRVEIPYDSALPAISLWGTGHIIRLRDSVLPPK